MLLLPKSKIMKSKFTLILLAVFFAISMTFQSCGDDEVIPDVLVTSNRSTGTFYKIDVKTGATTEIFTPTIGADPLKEIRAFVYHPKKKLFFASAASYTDNGNGSRAGFLYSINPNTKEATMINDNDGNGGAYAVWDAVVNWAVAKDDSLIAVGDFNSNGNGIVKFGTDGGRSLKTKQVDFCCGLGLIYDKSDNSMLVGSGEDTNNNEIDIVSVDGTGAITTTTTIATFNGFNDDFPNSWLTMKAMVKTKGGDIYGILYNTDSGKSFFVSIDLEGEEITYISTLGSDEDSQYNSLALISASFAKE